MKENKNIERLFQEKFKDFEALPPQESWNIIADRLNEKKKKRRIVPIWFQFSGVAATLLLVGALVWNFLGKNETKKLPNFENTIVNGYETDNKESNSKTKFTTDESLVYDTKLNNNNSNKNSLDSDQLNNNKSKIYKENLLNKQNKINSGKTNTIITYNELEKNTDSNYKRKKKSNNNFKQQRFAKENSEIVVVSNSKKSTTKRKSKYKSNKSNVGFENEISTDLIVADKSSKEQQIMKNDIDAFFEQTTTNKTLVTNNDSISSEKNNTNVLASTEIISKDSTLIAEVLKETNPLEELLKEKEVGKNEDEKEEKRSKWAISTNASPVYFNSLAEGSSIDEQFNSNSKNYTTTLSIGLAGSYAINDKLSLKTGVNSINLSYNTNDVVFESRMREVENNIPTISRNANASNMIFSSKNGTVNEISGDVENVIIDNNIGALKQNISYIEVPLELSYKLIDKKFGVEIIGGMSTLFLNQNNISLMANGLEMEVGRANNLNNIHFSSNVGLGFKYSFWKSFNANFQPMFKYQINTFNQNSSNFKPYFIGLYSGISFSF
jgi:hypothetical protein